MLQGVWILLNGRMTNTFSVAEVRKDTGKLEVTDIKTTSETTALKQFYKDHWNAVIFG